MTYSIVTNEIVNQIANEVVEQVMDEKNMDIVEFWMKPGVTGYFKTFKNYRLQADDETKPNEECILIDRINPKPEWATFNFEYEGTDVRGDFKNYILSSIERQRPMAELFLQDYDSPALD